MVDKDKSKKMLQEIKRKYPKCRVTMRIHHYDNLYVTLRSGNIPVLKNENKEFKGYASFYDTREIGSEYSDEMRKFWQFVYDTAKKYLGSSTGSNHDPMTDMFDIRYLLHEEIGSDDKPYINTAKQASAIARINKIASRILQ